ncbi:electron transfer flavoprotein subunit alpha [Caldimicrobium thiodismutans]|uniref:Electron transfer flavoprotein subunit alpha n=1 Tax=Caldimicrobium thiodismutans TaxID=1653476 RepID=A0A0U5ALY2_9BACT|nr:electron transfer flavoprotein subunit alpha/FixB family protein [Caldimicrobium thiodismutans]BAU23028.1 electron transfer flavoprotein subunit alpha [Caldimicrobium thiodismutans]
MKEVWVFIEQEENKIHPVSFELLGIANTLAEDLSGRIAGVILGSEVDNLAPEVLAYGAHKVYLVEHDCLKYYRHRPYAKALSDLAKKYHPEILLLGATPLGRDLAGGVATLLETGLTADVTELSIEKETGYLLMTRPAYGGNIMATIVCPHHRPQMATVRPRIFSVPERKENPKGEIIKEKIDLSEDLAGIERLNFIPKEKTVNLEYADVVVAGGKGIGGKREFEKLKELAELLSAELGASRLAVESGWISYEHQVGQTGKTVRPKVYLAFGISGAIQHRAGMQNSDFIIAVNTDKGAPIFKIADMGILGDWKVVAEALISALKKEKDK